MLLPLSFGCGVGSGFYHALLTLIRVSFTIRSEFGGGEKKEKKCGMGEGCGWMGGRGLFFLCCGIGGWVGENHF